MQIQEGQANHPAKPTATPEKVATKSLQHQVKYQFDHNLRPGQLLKKQEGGTTVYFFNPGTTTSRSSYTRSSVGIFTATAYTPYEGSSRGLTATGGPARHGVIAVDPRVIPLGSTCFVEGYGYAVAADTGGAIKGHIIDVCFPSSSQCRRWGRKKVVVHIFNEREFQWHVQHRKKGTKKRHHVKRH